MFSLLLLVLPGYIYNFHDWLNLPAMDQVVSITAGNNAAYVAVSHGVYEIDKSNRRLVRTITAADGIRGRIRAVDFDLGTGLLWILSEGNLLGINPFSNVSVSYDLPDDQANSLGISRNYIHLASDQGYQRLDKRGGAFDASPPGSDRVAWSGAKAPERPADYPFLTPWAYYDAQFNRYPITCVHRDGRTLWVGTAGYGVLRYSLATWFPLNRWQFGPGHGRLRSILPMGGSLWFFSASELTRYDPVRDSWALFPTPFNAFFLDSAVLLRPKILDLARHEEILIAAGDSSGYWFGTEMGVYHYLPKTDRFVPFFKLKVGATSMLLNADSIFIGTEAGLIRYDRRKGQLSPFADTLQQMHFGVYGIAATARRRYYAVYGGLETQDSLGDWQLMIPPGYLLSDHPYSLAAAGDKLFAATDQGVLVYSEQTGSFTTLSTAQGLQSDRVTSVYADADYLWVATEAGISRFDYHALFP